MPYNTDGEHDSKALDLGISSRLMIVDHGFPAQNYKILISIQLCKGFLMFLLCEVLGAT